MVKKEGPCCHCETMRSPLWRNGPPEKPVLCNACGTRWRTKGTLDNYAPARRPEDAEPETKQPKKRPVRRMAKKEASSGTMLGDADTSNPSGFGSAVSYSGSAQSHARESLVPSRKKTCVRRRKLSTVETLAKDLKSIMREEKLRSGPGVRTILGSSDEDLIYHSKNPAGSFEIGYGCMLLRHPAYSKSYIASASFSYPGPAPFALHSGRNRASNSNAVSEMLMWSPMRAHESARRDKLAYPKQRFLENGDSDLVPVPVEENFSNRVGGRGNAGGALRGPTKSSMRSLKRPHESQQQSFTDAEVRGGTMANACSRFGAMASSQQLRMPKSGNATRGAGAGAAALNQFMLPPANKNCDQESLLLEVPRNARHPEAELLRCWPPPSQLGSVTLTAALPPSYQSQLR